MIEIPKESAQNRNVFENILKSQTKLLNEYKNNLDFMKKKLGDLVLLNHKVQLLHIDSCKFLSSKTQESKYEKENYLLTLKEYCSEDTIFKIIPAFRF
jgi:inositol 1,4,5-triphosphate receptor type 1